MRCLAFVLFLSPWLAAQSSSVRLGEEAAAKTVFTIVVKMKLAGKMKLDRNGVLDAVPLEAVGKHAFTERHDDANNGRRLYSEASSTTVAGVERGTRTLAKDRRFILADRKTTAWQSWCPAGPLSHDDHSLVAEHFETLSLPGLLPNADVSITDTWPIADDRVAAFCLFDGVIGHSLKGTLVSLDATTASFTIAGTAEGVEHGAKVKLTIAAKGTFDRTAKCITQLTWEQVDDRDAGPISPAMEAKVTVTITRKPVAEAPVEFATPRPAKAEPSLLAIHYVQPRGEYELNHDRDWHPVVQSETHLVLRRVAKSELIAQATITPWKKMHPAVKPEENRKEFLDATLKQPGWEPEKTLVDGNVTTVGNHSVFRRVIAGKQDGLTVVQSFILITHDNGRQVIISCVARPELVDKLGAADMALAEAILIPAK